MLDKEELDLARSSWFVNVKGSSVLLLNNGGSLLLLFINNSMDGKGDDDDNDVVVIEFLLIGSLKLVVSFWISSSLGENILRWEFMISRASS